MNNLSKKDKNFIYTSNAAARYSSQAEARLRKSHRRVLVVTLLIVLLMVAFGIGAFSNAQPAFAYDEIDAGKSVMLSVEFGDSSSSAAEFRAYRIANMNIVIGQSGSNITFDFTDEYRAYRTSMPHDQAGYNALAETLACYIERDQNAPTSVAFTDAAGHAEFGSLERGLYLVLAPEFTDSETKETYSFKPCLVALPNSTDGATWIYDVKLVPKYTVTQKAAESTAEPISEKTEITVVKTWAGEKDPGKRPAAIEAELVSNGEVIDAVELSEENGWSHTWENLDASKTYKITEKEVPLGYTALITESEGTYTITNNGGAISPGEQGTPELPNTGVMWWPIPLIAGMIFVTLVSMFVKRKLRL